MPKSKKQKPKALVTGGAGFIGSHVVDALIKKGYRVWVIDDLSAGLKKNVNPKAKFVKMDVRSSKVREIFQRFRPDYVFHFAAQINLRLSVVDPVYDADINIMGSLNVIRNAVEYKTKKIIFSSSGGAICSGEKSIMCREDDSHTPASAYGVGKLSVEKYLDYFYQKYGLKYAALRFSNVYGPRQNALVEAGIVAIFNCNILSGEPVVIHGDGTQTRDYLFVDDAVKATLFALKSNVQGVYNFGTGKETSVNQVFTIIADALHYEQKPVYDRKADFGEKRVVLDCSRAHKELNWQSTVSIDSGLRQTCQWFVDNQKESLCTDMLCTFCYEGI